MRKTGARWKWTELMCWTSKIGTVAALAALFIGAASFGDAHAGIADQPEGQSDASDAAGASEAPAQPVLTKAPELVRMASASYPVSLLTEGIGGQVLLAIDIDAKGRVERAQVISASHPAFREPALAAAVRLRFTPAEINGEPGAIRIQYRYTFEPQTLAPDVLTGAQPAHSQGRAQRAVLRGRVREAGTRLPIGDAVVTVNGRPATETNDAGRFSVLGAPRGEFDVAVRAPGYGNYSVTESREANEALRVEYYLKKTSSPFETVVRTKAERREVAKVNLDREELEKVPGTFGDPVRVIESLPGLARTPGGVGGALLVYGARPSSSAVFFDGVEVPLLYHFGGLTSIVNPEFLESIDFYPAGFGARYGRATAGIVEVETRELDCELVRGVAEVDIQDASAFGCAPAGKWSVGAAARRSYIDAVLPLALNNIPQAQDAQNVTAAPVYWDYQTKAHRRWKRHELDLFAFGSDDRLNLVNAGSSENVDANLNLDTTFHRIVGRHTFYINDAMTLTTTLAPGFDQRTFDALVSGGDSNAYLRIWNVDWREDFKYELNDQVTLRAGLDHTFGVAQLRLEFPFPTELRSFPSPTFDFTEEESLSTDLDNFGQAYWVEMIAEFGPGIRLIPGLRFDIFDFNKTFDLAVQPRLTARWEFIEGSTVLASYGLYEKLPEPNFLIENIGNPELEPLRSQHFLVGVEHAFTDLIQLDFDVFYIDRDNIPSDSNTVEFRDGREIEEVWNSNGTGSAVGFQVLLRRLASDNGLFYGWLSYTFSRAYRRDQPLGATYTVERPNGVVEEVPYSARATARYPANFDQPHILSLVGQFVLPWDLEAGFRLRLVSGNPTTPTRQGRVYFDADENEYSVDVSNVPRNSGRLPLFHQLDVRIDKTWTFDLWKLTAYLEVFNAYNASNVESFQYDYRFRERTAITGLPIVPTLGVRGEF